MRIGNGYDVHKLVEGKKLVLGGEVIPHKKGVLGHSDGDVLVHAIMDAILGALALRDIGYHFPDTSKEFEGINSMLLLERVNKLMVDKGFKIVNIDSIIVAQAPKLSPYLEKMRENIAQCLGIEINDINIKATTEERLGFTGAEDGIKSYAVVLLKKS